MATHLARRWKSLNLAARRQAIQEYYRSADSKTAAAFLELSAESNGRDAAKIGEDLLPYYPKLAKSILLYLAHAQTLNPHTGERPGRTEATALFVRLCGRYVQTYGDSILYEYTKGSNGVARPFGDYVHMAAEWLAGRIAASPWGLFESRPFAPHSPLTQEWQDAAEAYVHVSGAFANAADGLASVELQGYTYDALLTAAELVAQNAEEDKLWRTMAAHIQECVLTLFWMPHAQYFCAALDRHPKTGHRRQVATLNANGALVLDSNLLTDLPASVRKPYVTGVAAMVASADFWTPAGVRTRALRHAGIIAYTDMYGSRTVWPKQTYDIAKGLRHCGRPAKAAKLEDAMLQAVQEAGDFYQFLLADETGAISHPHTRSRSLPVPPKPHYARTISAVLGIVLGRNSA
jgi:glycogen debranching enzyme